MARTFLLMCWLAIAGTPTTETVPLPEELLTEHTVAIYRLDLTKADPADAQTTLAYFLLRNFDALVAKRVEAIPGAIGQFRQAGGRQLVLIFDMAPAIAGETQHQVKSSMLVLLRGERVSENDIASAVYSLFPWLRPAESKLGKTRRIGPWLLLREEGRIVQTRLSAARETLLREALAAATGAPLSSIVLPHAVYLKKPNELTPFAPMMPLLPEVVWAFIPYQEQCLRFGELMPHIRWITTDVTLGLPPTVNLTMSVPDKATRAELVEIFNDFGWELRSADNRLTTASSATRASTLPDEAANGEASLHARIVPRRIVIAAIGGAEFYAPDRPRYDECLACGHFWESTIHIGQRQYRLSLFSGPRYGVRKPEFYTKLRLLEEEAASQPAEPIHNRASRLVEGDFDTISIPFAVGAVRYDPTADEILLLERPEMGSHKHILKHMYRIAWKVEEYEGTNDRFSQEAEISRVFQPDNRLSNWDFSNAPLRVNLSPPGMRPRIYYSTTQPGESEPGLPTKDRIRERGRR